jgi:hypothetical protein
MAILMEILAASIMSISWNPAMSQLDFHVQLKTLLSAAKQFMKCWI